ncbi:lysoplasmalogenase family protein [Tropicibacter sp. S64]|uniref:lysoplasmalogenase family protein n=1 Tax=Tropicibacter sp. S64 TaxID=3415122 RepID=UPI003C7C0E41
MIPSGPLDLLCAALFLGAAFAYPLLTGPGLTRSVVKTLPVLTLSLWSLLNGTPLLGLALALSAAGDWFLSRPGESAFLKGMAAFAAAHVTYIALFAIILWTTGSASFPDPKIRATFILLGLGGWLARFIVRAAGPLRLLVALYAALLLGMGALGFTLPPGPAADLVAIGASLFILSDGLIGLDRFLRIRKPGQGLAIWGLYCAAQVLLTLGLHALLAA